MAHDTVSTTGNNSDNLTGQTTHPPKSRIVSNDPTKDITGIGSHDGFKADSPKASVKLTTEAKVD